MGALESETLSASSRAFIKPGPTTWVQSVHVLMLVILIALQALPAACMARWPSSSRILMGSSSRGHRCGHSSAFNYKPIVRFSSDHSATKKSQPSWTMSMLDNFSTPCRLAENASGGAAMAGPSLPRPPALHQLHLARTGPIGPDRCQYNLLNPR